MIRLFLSLVPLVGTSLGSYLGVTKHNSKIDQQEDLLVAIATGILGAICINLCFEAFKYIRNVNLMIGMMTGVVFILLMNQITNQETTHSKLFWAMLIHNIPEGIVIGIALSSAINVQNIGIVASVSLQNIPDGLVVSMATSPKYGRRKAILLGVISGIVEPIATAIIIIATRNADISLIEPLFIGFSVAAIISIELDLLKSCKKMKLLIISFILTLLFNGILG